METDNVKSIFNEATTQLFRLNSLWTSANNYSGKGDYKSWNFTLDKLWRELKADAKFEDDKLKDIQDKYEFKWKVYCGVVNKNWNSKNKLYQALIKKEEFLRCLQDDVGKGTNRRSNYEQLM